MKASEASPMLRTSPCTPVLHGTQRLASRLRMRIAGPGCALLLWFPIITLAQDFRLDWWTVDAGGEVLSETADRHWQLSGTLGQWDSTDSLGLSGGGYTLIGGFWPASVERSEMLFRDGFERLPEPAAP